MYRFKSKIASLTPAEMCIGTISDRIIEALQCGDRAILGRFARIVILHRHNIVVCV